MKPAIFIAVVCILLLSPLADAFESCQIPPEFIWTDEAPNPCKMKIGGSRIEIDTLGKGSGRFNLKQDDKKYSIVLPMGPEDRLERPYVEKIGNLYAILYEYGDGEGSSCAIATFSTKDWKPIWQERLGGFNAMGEKIGDYVYIGAIGYVAKLDVRSKKIIWKHSGLYDSRKFNGPEKISLTQGKVKFIESDKIAIEVDDKSGRLLN